MSPSQWGPPTWIFLHTLAEKIKDESFAAIGPNLVLLITRICNNLPCPECAQHAKVFWAKVRLQNIKNKTDLINLLYVFHNTVNKRKRLPLFKYTDLQYYKTRSVVEAYNAFSRNFNTKGNMNLINESFHRGLMLKGLRQWLMENIQYFNL
jgi:hypothetical protein